MHFGISSAPEDFQRRQHEAFENLARSEVIVDDILVYGSGDTMDKAFPDHDANLRSVATSLSFDRLKSGTWDTS